MKQKMTRKEVKLYLIVYGCLGTLALAEALMFYCISKMSL